MTTPEEDLWFWQQNVNYATEITRAINEHVTKATPTRKALEPFQNRIRCALDSLRTLHGNARHDFRPDGMTLLRAMYDAHLQALYILADQKEADARAQLFIDFRWIEQRRMQELLERNPTRFAKTLFESPKRAEGEAVREANYQKLRLKYLTKKGKDRADWYPGTLRELAEAVGLESEYEILQRLLSGAVHSSPSALLVGPAFSDAEHVLLVGWRIMFRVLGRIAEHHGVELTDEMRQEVRDSMRNLFDQVSPPSGRGGCPPT